MRECKLSLSQDKPTHTHTHTHKDTDRHTHTHAHTHAHTFTHGQEAASAAEEAGIEAPSMPSGWPEDGISQILNPQPSTLNPQH